MRDHMNKSDIQIWKRVFDIIEGDTIRGSHFEELGQMMVEIQERLANVREAHQTVVNRLEAAERDAIFWRGTAAAGLADRDNERDAKDAIKAAAIAVIRRFDLHPYGADERFGLNGAVVDLVTHHALRDLQNLVDPLPTEDAA